jgi:hypothetical protein
MSHDLLVYGRGDIDELIDSWCAATERAGVSIELPEDFLPSLHAGFLQVRIEIAEGAPVPLATELARRGPHSGGFGWFVEHFEAASRGSGDGNGGGSLRSAEEDAVARSTFCAILTIGPRESAASCVAAFFCALGLAEAADGVVVDEEEDRRWTPERARAAAATYLEEVAKIQDRFATS